MNGDDTSLFLFTLGPVQGFIAAGRRTADLWAGSALLSRLAHTAACAVEDAAPGCDFLFPAFTRSAEATGLPNRFLVRVSSRHAARLGEIADAAVRDEMRRAAAFAVGRLDVSDYALDDAERFIETTWVTVSDKDADALFDRLYAEADEDRGPESADDAHARRYRLIEGLSGARKALRPFSGRAESGYRCSLIPTLPALVPPDDPEPRAVRTLWADIARKSGGRIRRGERLSTVALAKRYFPEYVARGARAKETFPSTSTFAAADFVKDVLERAARDDRVARAAAAYGRAIRTLPESGRFRESTLPALSDSTPPEAAGFARWSGRLLLSDLTEETFQDDFPTLERDTLRRLLDGVQKARDSLFGATTAAGIEPPSRYYALLILDGDRMGQWLSGERSFADRRRELKGPERHRAISEALRLFAGDRVPRIIETEHVGRLIYGGGDDVAAFLSFRAAADAARAVYRAFRASEVMGPNATASAGLAFAHHLTPLQVVLDAARAAEHRAKSDGRDRLAFAALKRAGAPATATVRWDDVSLLQAYRDLVGDGADDASVSTAYVHDLSRLARRSVPTSATVTSTRQEAFAAEARRLFGRRLTVRPEAGSTDAVTSSAFERSVGGLLEALGPHGTVNALHVAQFIGRGGDR